MSDVDAWVSVDVETAGPHPTRYSMLSIGACLVARPDVGFYAELQPLTQEGTPEALAVSGLSLSALAGNGTPPAQAMAEFAEWLDTACAQTGPPVFVGFNAAFDWMFVNDYFHRFVGSNPFGHAAVDIKSFYMGLTGSSWPETSMAAITAHYGEAATLTHHALQDAKDQAALFRRMLEQAGKARGRNDR